MLNALLYETHVGNLGDCADCMWRHVCAGGCPALARSSAGLSACSAQAGQRVDAPRPAELAESTPSAGAATESPAATTDVHYRQWWCQMCQELLPRLTWHVARELFAAEQEGRERVCVRSGPTEVR